MSPMNTNNEQRRNRWGCAMRLLVALLAVVLVLSLFFNCVAVGLLAGDDSSDLPEDEFPDFVETPSYGDEGPKVVRIACSGVLTHLEAGSWGVTRDPVESVVRRIRAAANDDDVAGILFEVDSPGGGVTCADEIYHELVRFKESREGRVVVGLAQDLAASGGYYVLLPCDEIVAQPTGTLGSIGVIVSGVNAAALADKLGIRDATVASGANKDLLNPLKPIDEGHLDVLRAVVSTDYERFLSLVAKHRGGCADDWRPLCDGRIFSAEEALRHDFIDSIGYREDAIDRLAALLGAESVQIVKYDESPSFFDELFGSRLRGPAAPSALLSLVESLAGGGTPRLEYRYAP